MKKVFKTIAIAYLVALIIGLIYASITAFNGNYLAKAGFFSTSIIAISICFILVFLLWAIKFVNKFNIKEKSAVNEQQ